MGYSTPRAGSYLFPIYDREFPYLKRIKKGFSFCSERQFNLLKDTLGVEWPNGNLLRV